MGHTQIICLANSWKYGDRCIAGIELQTGQWIRPVSSEFPEDGRVPRNIRVIRGYAEPSLLDVLEIPLAATSADFDYACENRVIAPGEWRVVRKATVVDIIPFISVQDPILHNSYKYVTVSFLRSLPLEQRRTLQLLYTDALETTYQPRTNGGNKWKATFSTCSGYSLIDCPITDPEFVDLLERNQYANGPCLVTVSLSVPHEPPDWTGSPEPCWKLVASVIELSRTEQILVEMHLAGWSIQQGREYVMQTYGKRSRSELTKEEKIHFIHYLKQERTKGGASLLVTIPHDGSYRR
jgi:hypothetical protein